MPTSDLAYRHRPPLQFQQSHSPQGGSLRSKKFKYKKETEPVEGNRLEQKQLPETGMARFDRENVEQSCETESDEKVCEGGNKMGKKTFSFQRLKYTANDDEKEATHREDKTGRFDKEDVKQWDSASKRDITEQTQTKWRATERDDKENINQSNESESDIENSSQYSGLDYSSSSEADFVFNKHDIYSSSDSNSIDQKETVGITKERISTNKPEQASRSNEPEYSPFKNFVPISKQKNPIPIDFKNQFKASGSIDSLVKRGQKRKSSGRKKRKPRKKRKTVQKAKGKMAGK